MKTLKVVDELLSWNTTPDWVTGIEKAYDKLFDLLVNIRTRDNHEITVKVIVGENPRYTRGSCIIFVQIKDRLSTIKQKLLSMLAKFRSRSKNKKPRPVFED